MKKLSYILVGMSIFLTSFGQNKEYDPRYNMEYYFEKGSLIQSDFYPEVQENDLRTIIQQFTPGKERPNYISLKLEESKWEDFMNHYYSEDKFEDREWFQVHGMIHEEGEYEDFKGKMKHRGSYSSKSLKVGFRVKTEKDLKSGTFKGKKRFIIRNLAFDRTGTNESAYFLTHKIMHKELLGFDSHWIDYDFYWLFINGKPYGYVLAMDDSKKELLKNRTKKQTFNDKKDCLIKAKYWSEDIAANMEYREKFEDINEFTEIYRIEEGNKEACHKEVLAMMKLLRNKDYQAVAKRIKNVDQIIFYAQFQYLTHNKAGISQNHLYVIQDGKWEIAPWDADIALDYTRRFDPQYLKINKLFEAALKIKKERFAYEEMRSLLTHNFKTHFEEHRKNIQLDRKIWGRYVPKDDKYSYSEYYKYAIGELSESQMNSFITKIFLRTYNNIKKLPI